MERWPSGLRRTLGSVYKTLSWVQIHSLRHFFWMINDMKNLKTMRNVSIITTLFKTPKNKLRNLKNYRNFKTLIFEQEEKNSYLKLKKF